MAMESQYGQSLGPLGIRRRLGGPGGEGRWTTPDGGGGGELAQGRLSSCGGDGATLCKGVTIGENSIIGAGSVVTKSIPKNVVATMVRFCPC